MSKERLPSEIIADFIDLLSKAPDIYKNAKDIVDEYDSKSIDWIHKIENGMTAEERSKIATAFHNERIDRRKQKNTMVLYKDISDFATNERNKIVLRQLKPLFEKQKKEEAYIASENKVLKSKKKLIVNWCKWGDFYDYRSR